MTVCSAEEQNVGFTQHFQNDWAVGWTIADYTFSHPHFDTDWSASQIALKNGVQLSLSPNVKGTNNFLGASFRRETTSHYGRYEVVIQPARGEGVVTGFFTYTGPYYGTRHDEIDIEFLGKDTTKLHVAWFVNGQLTNHFIDLGFDAAERPRHYSFEWWPDKIRWFVENKLVFEITQDGAELPKVPGYLFANIWAASPSLDAWSGTPALGTSASAYVGMIRHIPLNELIAPLS